MADTARTPDLVEFSSAPGRWILAATVAGSGVAMLTGTVVNVALPAIGEHFDAGTAGLQWVVNGYMLTLASLILLGGSLGDRLGRRRVFVVGIVVFTVASAVCAVAVSLPMLVASRIVMGVGGALLTPGSLAIIQASFVPRDRPRAIGAWSALGGIAAAVGPFLGGWLVDAGSWRAVFLLNIPLAVGVIYAAVRHVPESRDPDASSGIDAVGAVLATVALGTVTYAVIAAPQQGMTSPLVLTAAVAGVVAGIAFVVAQARIAEPMLPLTVFSSRQFSAANGVTFVVYAALGALFFLLVVYLQQVLGYSALAAGTAAMPVTVLLFLLSERGGELAQRIGPRRPLTFGPLLIAVGFGLLSTVGPDTPYVTGILPGLVVFGLGLALTVAPVTSTVMAAVDERHSGIASGVNNAVARTAQLLAVAAIPVAAGLGADGVSQPDVFADAFPRAMWICAGLSAIGGVLAALTISDDVLADDDDVAAGGPGRGGEAESEPARRHHRHCAVDGPPLRREPDRVGG